jgi:hypothetical protein
MRQNSSLDALCLISVTSRTVLGRNDRQNNNFCA